MGDYYNKTRAPIAVTTRRGSSVSVGPKKWLTLDPADEGHESLQRAVSKGFLVRSASAPVAAIPVVAAPTLAVVAPVSEAKQLPDVAPEVVGSGSADQTVTPAEEKPKALPTAPAVRSGKKGR